MLQPTYPRFGQFNTEERIIRSNCVDQAYQIGIWFPFSYASSDQKYPVLVVPDGEFAFGLATGLIPILIGTQEVPEIIVVGIAYHDIRTWQEHGVLRDQDYCAPGFQSPGTESRLEQFTNFVKVELLPLLETEYRADPIDRALFGFSSGGFFTLHTMFTQPGLFRRYIAASCTWPGADKYLLDCESQYAALPNHPPTDLYLTIGGMEDEQLPGFQAITEQLRARNNSNLRLSAEILEGEGHNAGVLAKTFLNGMRAVYKR